MSHFWVCGYWEQHVKIIEQPVYGDNRGFFTESYSKKDFVEAGIDFDFVQDNHAYNAEAGILRGLHYQKGDKAQTRLIRVIEGAVYDVVVDMREGSPTYGQWEGNILSSNNGRQLLIPKGFSHAYLALTPNTHFFYKCDGYYDTEADAGIAFDDPQIGIEWPIDISKAITSEKDLKNPTLVNAETGYVFGEI